MTIRWIIFKLLDKSTDHATQTEMIREIRAMGHDIRLACGYRDRKKDYGLDPGAIRYFDLPRVRKIRALCFAAAVAKEVFHCLFLEKPEALLIDYSVNLIAAPLLWAARAAGCRTKVVLDVRTLPVNVRTFRAAVLVFFASLRIARWTCHGVTYITKEMQRYCEMRVPRPGPETAIWTSGVNALLFDPARAAQWVSGKDFRLFYHGGLSLSRGIGSLIRAVKILRDGGCPADLTLVGICVDRLAIASIIRENGLEPFCRVLAPVPYAAIPDLIGACDLPVIPFPDFMAWRVSSPIKLIEYMAMGKALVVTDIAAHRDVLNGVPYAFYARDDSPEALAEAIRTAYARRTELKSLGIEARETVREGYTWKAQAGKLTAFLAEI